MCSYGQGGERRGVGRRQERCGCLQRSHAASAPEDARSCKARPCEQRHHSPLTRAPTPKCREARLDPHAHLHPPPATHRPHATRENPTRQSRIRAPHVYTTLTAVVPAEPTRRVRRPQALGPRTFRHRDPRAATVSTKSAGCSRSPSHRRACRGGDPCPSPSSATATSFPATNTMQANSSNPGSTRKRPSATSLQA